jgi:hypothetical protein
MKPTKTLPPDYKPLYILDLTKNFKAAIFLNLGALLAFFLYIRLFIWIGTSLRPELGVGELISLWSMDILTMIAAFVIMVFLHEGFHGFFFWLITKERPKFGFKLAYAYAAAPDWYIPRNQFIIVGLAPLVLIAIIGIALMPFLPLAWIPTLIFLLIFNSAGAMGDVVTVVISLFYPKQFLVNDLGDSFTIYGVKRE